jgi:hypothetical protein
MKEFNLERALAGDPVVTRDGRPVKIAGYNGEAEEDEFCLLGWANNMNHGWHSDGTYMRGVENGKDLFMAPTERKEWIVRYQHGTPIEEIEHYIAFSGPFYSLEKAQRFAKDTEGSIHEITIHE